MSSTAAGSTSGASEKTTRFTVQHARRSVMVGGKCSANDVSERLRRNVVGQLARGERPWGRWDEPLSLTMLADSWGVLAGTNGQRCSTRSTGRVGDGAEAIRWYPVVAGRTFATKTSVTAVSVPRSTKSVSSTRTSVGRAHAGQTAKISVGSSENVASEHAGPSRARTGF